MLAVARRFEWWADSFEQDNLDARRAAAHPRARGMTTAELARMGPAEYERYLSAEGYGIDAARPDALDRGRAQIEITSLAADTTP